MCYAKYLLFVAKAEKMARPLSSRSLALCIIQGNTICFPKAQRASGVSLQTCKDKFNRRERSGCRAGLRESKNRTGKNRTDIHRSVATFPRPHPHHNIVSCRSSVQGSTAVCMSMAEAAPFHLHLVQGIEGTGGAVPLVHRTRQLGEVDSQVGELAQIFWRQEKEQ